MNDSLYSKELSRCVQCGACKAFCPTYAHTRSEPMGARGRVAILGALDENTLTPSKSLSDKIFSCLLCEACKGLCPTGIDIPETIYRGRALLKHHYGRGRLLSKAVQLSMKRMDTVFTVLRGLQRGLFPLLYRSGRIRHMPKITSLPFKNSTKVYKGKKTIGRVSIFAGCSINYFYPRLGESLLHILLSKDYEVVVLKGEVCCGAPLRAYGLENDMNALAQKNIELFSKMQVEAILSLCPTCTLTIRNQYPLLVNGTIEKIMDVNEFFFRKNITQGLNSHQRVLTYHDPCHLRYGLGIQEEPREILKGIEGIKFIEMKDAGECCGFGGFFSMDFRELSKKIGEKKLDSAASTWADTIITSCPGCMMQLEDIKIRTGSSVNIMHIVELIDEAMPE